MRRLSTPGTHVTVIVSAVVTAVVLFVGIALAVFSVVSSHHNHSEQKIVVEFFEELVSSGSSVEYDELHDLCEKYFSEESMLESEDGSGLVDALYVNILGLGSEDLDSCSVEFVADGFTKVTLLDSTGSKLNPPVGFEFESDGERILKWRISRLQPFSSKSDEYSELWGVLYD